MGTDNWVLGNSGEYYYMGNSSSNYIANRLNPTAETLVWHKYPHYQDTTWLGRCNRPEIPTLPPLEIAQRLFRAQHAYIGTIFSFLSNAAFNQRLGFVRAQVIDPSNREERLVYCQILLVFAFGQMYSINQWVAKDGPPGFEYFKHALEFLPNVYEQGSILFIEVLSYVAYFMQTINRRDAAYIMIGIALRMATSLGLHQEVSDPDIDSEIRENRRRVWWSVYSMERLLCVTSGNPLSIQDEDIDLFLPSPKVGEDAYVSAILARYTELSRIQGIVSEKIYRKKQKSSTDLSACIQQIMKMLAEWFERCPESIRSNPPDSGPPPSREVNSNMGRWEDGLSPDIVHVINRAISAARSSASILNAAAKYNLVATYGFIDGEQAFSAALLLVMVNIAFPYQEADALAMNMALDVLHSMAEKGNRYIQACHALLTKIKSPVNPKEQSGSANALDSSTQIQSDILSQASDIIPGPPQHQNQPFGLDFEGDPALWAEVLKSIDIDMDRQWIETALRRGEQLETPDSTTC
ncbi:hypothetical protein FNYG_14777 [Fusarium nygamai]|uniref:Xylanolytic transcriptional activator regulatory domain-containing protein n=1 Tax=Gibberella nygamai TaxID=42673 RepID=A0A2K0UQ65_GIBNY|nr:hypothetical protein FNYG_14777 [Fusarium nygamai]